MVDCPKKTCLSGGCDLESGHPSTNIKSLSYWLIMKVVHQI